MLLCFMLCIEDLEDPILSTIKAWLPTFNNAKMRKNNLFHMLWQPYQNWDLATRKVFALL